MRAEQAALEAMLVPLSAASALDIGTGSGRCLPLLARTGAARIVGLDLSMPMLSHNRSSASLLCAEAEHLPLPAATFDLALASLVVGHIADFAGWVRESRRVLRQGGQLLYSDFHPDGAKAGWQRTFRTAAGQVFAVRHYIRSVAAQCATLRAEGLALQEVREPRLGELPDPQVEAFHKRWGDPPVVVIFHATKVS
jgi:ubiquinone/menaquinone biosynthesis C-methylase UbiE